MVTVDDYWEYPKQGERSDKEFSSPALLKLSLSSPFMPQMETSTMTENINWKIIKYTEVKITSHGN